MKKAIVLSIISVLCTYANAAGLQDVTVQGTKAQAIYSALNGDSYAIQTNANTKAFAVSDLACNGLPGSEVGEVCVFRAPNGNEGNLQGKAAVNFVRSLKDAGIRIAGQDNTALVLAKFVACTKVTSGSEVESVDTYTCQFVESGTVPL
jgi:hypothetical protein